MTSLGQGFWKFGMLALLWVGAQGCGDDDGGTAPELGGGGGGAPGPGGVAGDAGGGRAAGGGAGGDGGGGRSAGGASPGAEAGSSGAGAVASAEGGAAGAVEPGEAGRGGSAGAAGGGAISDDFLPLYESGTRLRAVSLGAEGSSSRRLVSWYDTELETECSFARAEDGEFRCLPRARELASGFLDDQCSQRVHYDALVTPCESHSGYRLEATTAMTCAASRVVRLQRVEAREVFLDQDPCAGSIELDAAATVWEDLEVLPPETFVRGSFRERVGSGGFGVRERVAEDGSREVVSIVDGERGTCRPRELAGAGIRCTPNAAFLDSEWWFADECNSEQLAYGAPPPLCNEPEKVALAWLDEPPPNGLPSLVSLGEPYSDTTVYERGLTNGVCSPVSTASVSFRLFPIEGDIDETELLPLEQSPAGDGPIQTIHEAVEGMPLTFAWVTGSTAPPFYDAERGRQCQAYRADSGWVCVPRPHVLAQVLYYADPSCTEPAVRAVAGSSPDFVIQGTRTMCTRDSSAQLLSAVYEVEDTDTGELYTGTPGDCALVEDATEYHRLRSFDEPLPELDEMTE